MSDQSKRLLLGSARAATGVVIIGASVGVALLLGTGIVPVPSIDRGVVSVAVDSNQDATFSLVCAGAFAELGADPSQPTVAIPGGDTQLVLTGTPIEESELERQQSLGSAPRVLDTTSNAPLAAAELQQVLTPTLQGLAASSCAEPVHEQWLVGGGTTLGLSTTVVLGNPFEVPATVQLSIYDQSGPLDSSGSAGVLVPAGTQRIVSINGYAPGREQLAVLVESSGAAVTATLGVSQTVDIRSYAVDMVTRQLAPAQQLVFPAVENVTADQNSGVGLATDGADFPVSVRLLAPDQAGAPSGEATILALRPQGEAVTLGTIKLDAGVVTQFNAPEWPSDAQAIVVESELPVVGGVFGSSDLPPSHDYAWFAPAPALPVDTDVALAVVSGGELVLANPGAVEATVSIEPDDGTGEARAVKVPAGGAVSVNAQGENRLRSDVPLWAGVRVVKSSYIAGYPVLPPIERSASLTVYPR